MEKIISTTVNTSNYAQVLSNLNKIASTRPLTSEEKVIGRKAAKLQMVQTSKTREDSEKRFYNTLIETYMKQGYSNAEAREKIRLEDRQHLENIGMGISCRCKFDQPQ